MLLLRGKKIRRFAALLLALCVLGAALAEGEFAPLPAPAPVAAPSMPELFPEENPTPAPAPVPVEAPAATATPVPEEVPEEAEETIEVVLISDLEIIVAEEILEGSEAPRAVPMPEVEGMDIPALYQRDYREAVCRYNGRTRTVASSGCGAVCVSMVVAYLTGDEAQTPTALFRRAVQKGEYSGSGLSHETLSDLLAENGVQSEWIANSAAKVAQALREGKPVVAHVGPGTFTRNGHYIVLRGITDDGQVVVNDPASPDRTEEGLFSLESVVRQARREDSFMVCWTDDPAPESTPVPAIIAAARSLSIS